MEQCTHHKQPSIPEKPMALNSEVVGVVDCSNKATCDLYQWYRKIDPPDLRYCQLTSIESYRVALQSTA